MQFAEQHVGLFKMSDFMDAGLETETDGTSASAIIGPKGGMLIVTDPASPIYGTSLKVPVGALDAPVKITIQEGGHDCAFGLGPSLKLLPSGLHFKRAAILSIYLNETIAAADDFDATVPACYHYDESGGQWVLNSATRLEMLGDTVLCELHHL